MSGRNKRFMQTIAAVAISGVGLCLPVWTGAQAAEGALTVNANMARLLRINSPAATIIVGNPGVADVTIQDPMTMIITGKSYGRTNLIILDANGNPIADTFIEVVQAQADLVTVYNGQSRATLACTPVCQPTIMLGDDSAVTSGTVASQKLVLNAAQ